jgi:hypothetical protein
LKKLHYSGWGALGLCLLVILAGKTCPSRAITRIRTSE